MSLTCIACKLLFSIPELHQEHYKSDWHRYNLKRRIAELPPLTKEEFEERSAAFDAAKKEKEKVTLKCTSCNKHFSSQNAMTNHLKSKKHSDVEVAAKAKSNNATKDVPLSPTDPDEDKYDELIVADTRKTASDYEWSDADSDWESYDEEEDDHTRVIVDTNDCLFCDHQTDSTENNVQHMTEVHSFFIPDIQYVSDIDGLIAYLAGKIHVGHICLWCNGKGKGFKSVKSVKQHMVDKGHCKMLHEGEALVDYADFYDYSSSDVNNESFDDDAITDLLVESDFELVLPSGSTIGHRSLAVYYKQNLRPMTTDNEKKVKKVLQHYKALGYLGATGPAATKKARDIVFMQKVKSRYSMKLGIKNNKMQPHFRSQVMF